MMKFLLGLLILMTLLFTGMFNYCSRKKTANELVHKYIEERNTMEKEDFLCANMDETLLSL